MLHLKCNRFCIMTKSTQASLVFQGLTIKHATVEWAVVRVALLQLDFQISVSINTRLNIFYKFSHQSFCHLLLC